MARANPLGLARELGCHQTTGLKACAALCDNRALSHEQASQRCLELPEVTCDTTQCMTSLQPVSWTHMQMTGAASPPLQERAVHPFLLKLFTITPFSACAVNQVGVNSPGSPATGSHDHSPTSSPARSGRAAGEASVAWSTTVQMPHTDAWHVACHNVCPQCPVTYVKIATRVLRVCRPCSAQATLLQIRRPTPFVARVPQMHCRARRRVPR